MTDGFFDPYPSFYETPRKPRDPEQLRTKLNRRHRLLIEKNAATLADKRVLDLASHDGRWSFAALKAGARSIIGVEPRAQLVDYARDNFRRYQIDRAAYDFVVGDAFDVLAERTFEVDVVFCFGFFYHTARHVELLTLLQGVEAECFIFDTTVSERPGPVVELRVEDVVGLGRAFRDDSTVNDAQIVGWPSRDALLLMLEHFGHEVLRVDAYRQRHFHRLAVTTHRARRELTGA